MPPGSTAVRGGEKGSIFLESLKVGVQGRIEPPGGETPAPVLPTLHTPAPSSAEAPTNLASLARLTAIHYSRFVNGDQRPSVFTIDTGSLGQIQLKFVEHEAGITLQIVVESPEVRQMLHRALSQLEQQWLKEGLDFAEVNVEVDDSEAEDGFPGGDQTHAPTARSEEIDQVPSDGDDEGIRDYGYNTVEFVA